MKKVLDKFELYMLGQNQVFFYKGQKYKHQKSKREPPLDPDTCSPLFSNKEVDIGDYSDWEEIDDKHYCPDCYGVEVIDGVYNVKVK